MKYAIVSLLFCLFCHFSLAERGSSQSNNENCAYSKQDIHTVSENPYRNLLARLSGDQTSDRNRNKRRGDESTGQR